MKSLKNMAVLYVTLIVGSVILGITLIVVTGKVVVESKKGKKLKDKAFLNLLPAEVVEFIEAYLEME